MARTRGSAKDGREEFVAAADGWIAGRMRRVGERIRLSRAEAKYERVTPAEREAKAPLKRPSKDD